MRNVAPNPPESRPSPPRLNLLLSAGGADSAGALGQLETLLGPHGIECLRAGCGEEAAELIRLRRIHIAVVDWAIPLRAASPDPAGHRLLQLLRRAEPSPPVVVVRPRQAVTRENVRGLSDALREGAFAVLDRPLQLETLLEVLRRIVRRHYHDHWPAA